jgi:hypothetical protein
VIIRKNGDRNYSNSKIYKLIVLLNILRKALEAIVSNRIYFLTKIYTLLPNTQMRAQRIRSTDIVLQLITEKIYAIWRNNKYKIAFLLNFDVNGAFNRVLYTRLIHNLRKKKFSESLFNWTQNFLLNKLIKFYINDFILLKSSVLINISQNSLILLILYLFYNADLLKAYENI